MNGETVEKKVDIKSIIEAQEKTILSMEKEIQDKFKEKDDTIEDLKKKITEIQEIMLKEKEKTIDELQEKQKCTQVEFKKEKEKIEQDMQKKIQDTESKAQDREKTIQNLNTELSNIQEKIKNFEEQNSRQIKVIKNLKEQAEQKHQEIVDKEKQLEKALAADEQLIAKINELKSELTQKIEQMNEKQKQTEEIKKEQKNLQDEFEKLKLENQNLKQQKTGLIQGRENIITIMNNLLDNAKMRVLMVAPTLEDIGQIELQKIDKRINIRVATHIDLSNEKHKEILDIFRGFPNITFRNFDKQDRWGLEHDREEIILASHSSTTLPMGMLSNDPKHIEFFLALLSEAWISGKTL